MILYYDHRKVVLKGCWRRIMWSVCTLKHDFWDINTQLTNISIIVMSYHLITFLFLSPIWARQPKGCLRNNLCFLDTWWAEVLWLSRRSMSIVATKGTLFGFIVLFIILVMGTLLYLNKVPHKQWHKHRLT